MKTNTTLTDGCAPCSDAPPTLPIDPTPSGLAELKAAGCEYILTPVTNQAGTKPGEFPAHPDSSLKGGAL